MRCLTVSKGTVMEESKLCFPAVVNLWKVAPGNHFGTYLTGWVRQLPNLREQLILTEWENIDHPLSGRKTALDGVHGFIRAVEYRMIRRFYAQSVCNLQSEHVRQTL